MEVADRHASCFLAFNELCEAAVGSKEHTVLLDEFDKYRLWAGNVGAVHSGRAYKLSLDYRLRESTFYKDTVCALTSLSSCPVNIRFPICSDMKCFPGFHGTSTH